MQIDRQDLAETVKADIITEIQAEKLWQFWKIKHEDIPSFRMTHLFYYFGGLLAISAMTLFITTAWERMRGIPLFTIAFLMIVLGLLLTRHFLNKKLTIPAGIMATFSLALVPLAVYNLQVFFGFLPPPNLHYEDFNPFISWYWVPMEITTLFVGSILLYIYRFPFLLFPTSIVLWYMSMDLWPLINHMHQYDFQQRALFSMVYGLIFLAISFYVDIRQKGNRKDYAFWLYIFSALTFWGGLSCQESNSELSKAIYCFINILMIFGGVILNRRIFTILGAMGILGYLGHLAHSVFGNSLIFPVALVFLGILIIFAGVKWTQIENQLLKILRPYIPEVILKRNNKQR